MCGFIKHPIWDIGGNHLAAQVLVGMRSGNAAHLFIEYIWFPSNGFSRHRER
jgi:hypothetical protein